MQKKKISSTISAKKKKNCGDEFDNVEVEGVEVSNGVKGATFVKIFNERIVKWYKSILVEQSKTPKEIQDKIVEIELINTQILKDAIKDASEADDKTIKKTTNDVDDVYENNGGIEMTTRWNPSVG